MNLLAHKCKHCKKAFQARKSDQIYCSPKCKQAAYRKRQEAGKRKKQATGERAVAPALCEHCGGSYWAKTSRSRFCSTSCRTLFHRSLRATIPGALSIFYGIPEDKALDVLETQPIGKLRQILEGAGYSYAHDRRAWIMPHANI